MLIQKNMPSVYWNDNGSNIGVSYYMLSFGRDALAIDFNASQDKLFFGRYKPFNMIYVEMKVPNTNANTIAVEVYDGASWVSVENLVDDTRGFTRSGAIQFDALLVDEWKKYTVASQENFYIRISCSANFSAGTEIQGMNIVFSDDQDLEAVYPGVSNYKASSELSFILRHENSRNLIVQDIRNSGVKKSKENGEYDNIDAWDFLEFDEIKMWSVYLTLHNIFSSLQSKEDGLYKQKADEYAKNAEDYRASFYLTIDKNDNGIKDTNEAASDITTKRISRS